MKRLWVVLAAVLLFSGCTEPRPIKYTADRIRYWKDDRAGVCFATLLPPGTGIEQVVSVSCPDVPKHLLEESPNEDWRPPR